MHSKILLPTYKEMEKTFEKQSDELVYLHLSTQKTIDQNGNISQHFDSDEEKKHYQILVNYRHYIKYDKTFLINEVFFASIVKGKLSTKNLLVFFRDHSWFGKTLEKKLTNNETINFNWLDLISPAIHNYFTQMQYYFLNPVNIPNFVLCIDSLSLKIEGLLRDLCSISGIPTSKIVKDSAGRKITQEKDIHKLLYEKKIKELLNQDDLLLLRFLLVEKAGCNLRHKVAHSLMMPQEYAFEYMHLLILALLRIGKYDFV